MKKIIIIILMLVISIFSGCTEEETQIEEDTIDYQNKYENLEKEVEENEINRTKYEKLMFQGIRKNIHGDYSYGYATADFASASIYYDTSYLEDAIMFFNSADAIYASANNYYKEAESYFNRAIKFAPNNDLKELTSLMKDEAMYGALVTSALHQNCEYMSSACNAYNNGNYAIGDEQLEIANSFIIEHDSLIPPFENTTTDINSLLDIL